MNRKADAIIVGAGVIGSAVAFELQNAVTKHSISTNYQLPDMVLPVIHAQLYVLIIQPGTV